MRSENQKIRIKYIKTLEDNGIMQNFVSKKTEIPNSSLSRWKSDKFDFGKEKLFTMKVFLSKYDN